jgi:peptide/nickel transport system substrate-binding protein
VGNSSSRNHKFCLTYQEYCVKYNDKMKKLFIFLIFLFVTSCNPEKGKKSISIGFMGSLITLDPHMRSEAVTVSVNSNIFESLVQFDVDMNVKPCLAESWKNIAPNTWLFYIRAGVLFHNLDTLSPHDIKFSLKRALEHPNSELKGNLLKVKKVEVVNKNTVEITTTELDFTLLNKLANVPILSKKYTENNDPNFLSSHPVGTGPYKFTEWEKDKYVALKRFDKYWGEIPQIEEVETIFYSDLDNAVSDLVNGYISILSNFPCNEIEKLKDCKRIELVYTPSLSVRYLGFNMNSPVLCNKKLRLAIYYGINRDKLIEEVRRGYAKKATQLLNPRVYGYNPQISQIPYDTVRARQLMKEGGVADGVKLRLLFFEARKEIAQVIKEELEKIDINVQLVPKSAKDLFKDVKKGDFDIFIASYISTSGDAEQGLCEEIHSRDVDRGYGLLNYENFSDEKIDMMIENLQSIDSPIDRLKMMKKIMACVMDELPCVPLFVSEDLYAKESSIEWKPRLDGSILVKEISFKEN